MTITGKHGNSSAIINKKIDVVRIEWYEANKRILHKQTSSGINVVLKFLNNSPEFADGDILWQDDNSIIVVEINPCDCMVISPSNILEASAICYEIGNRHLPLFYDGNDLVTPYEVPLYNLLSGHGYRLSLEKRKLLNPFKTTALPHLQVAGADRFYGKTPRLTTSS